jgi:hypothetical protein
MIFITLKKQQHKKKFGVFNFHHGTNISAGSAKAYQDTLGEPAPTLVPW